MEVLIHEKLKMDLRRSDPNDKIVLPDGTTSIGFIRKACVYPIWVTEELMDRLLFVGLPHKVEIDQEIPGLEVCLGFQGTTDPGKCVPIIELRGGDQLLQSLYGQESHCLEEAKIQLEVIWFEAPAPCTSKQIHFTPVEKLLLFSPGKDEAKRVEVSPDVKTDDMIKTWRLDTWKICGNVRLVPSRTNGDVAVLDVKDPLAVTRRMLTDEILADTNVVAQNGAKIKFHRCVLAAHSPAFELFKTKMQEVGSRVVELQLDMSEESVRALKEYLYVWELKAPQESSLVCFELFEAGQKYGISTLEAATSKIMLKMGGAWYSAVVALRLFLLVKDMDLPRLKQKAVEILKSMREEVMTLEQFRDLFRKENGAVGKELTECLLASP